MTERSAIYEIHHRRYSALTFSTVVPVKIADGMAWAEGPVWFAEHDCLVWSDLPNDKMWRYLPGLGSAVFRAPSNFSKGSTRDREGRLVVCERGGRRVTRTQPDGSIEIIADAFDGRKLTSPSDVVVAADDAIWFSDAADGGTVYGEEVADAKAPEYGGCYVFRVDPLTRRVEAMLTDLAKPSGLAFSPDGNRLYVADSGMTGDPDGPHHIRAFSVADGKRLSDGKVFAEIRPGVPRGLRTDSEGNVWTSARDGVHTIAPDGTLLGKMKLPAVVSNLCFGGPRRNRLFVTATDSVWMVAVNISGSQHP
jgi:gluconolactonase